MKSLLMGVAVGVSLVLAGNAQGYDRITGAEFASRSEVIAPNVMAATSQPLATQIALDIMRRGGNAIDAAIAANAALGLMEPTGNGIGGDASAEASAFGGASNNAGAGSIGDAGVAIANINGGGLITIAGQLRLNADGTPDTTCGDNGWVSWTTGGPANPYKVRVMPDGRYAVGGLLGVASIWMFKADCTLDTSWGNAGKANMPSPTATEITSALNDFDVASDGSIVATVANTLSGRLLVARFLPSGDVDTSFGTSGYVSVAPADNGSPKPGAIRFRPSGTTKQVLSLRAASRRSGPICAVRYIRAPDRALTTLTKPPRPAAVGVNPEYP